MVWIARVEVFQISYIAVYPGIRPLFVLSKLFWSVALGITWRRMISSVQLVGTPEAPKSIWLSSWSLGATDLRVRAC